MRCHLMSAVYLVVGAVAILGAVHLFQANDQLGLVKRSSSSYEDTLVRLGHRSEETSDFDDRIESEHDLSFKINEMLDQVIELEALKTHHFDAMLKLISSAQEQHKIDPHRAEAIKSKVRTNKLLWSKTSTTTTTTTTTKSTKAPVINSPVVVVGAAVGEVPAVPAGQPVIQRGPPQKTTASPEQLKMREEAEKLVPKPSMNPFRPVTSSIEDDAKFMKLFNDKRRFMYAEREKIEEKNFQGLKNKARVAADQRYKVLLENRKVDESYKPAKPPAAGAKFDAQKREWSITDRPTPTPGPPTTTTQNPLTDDDLTKVREQIQMINDQAAHGPYSKDAGEYYDNIFLIQVHSRTDFTKFFLETVSKQPNLSKSKNLIVISHDIWREDMNFLTQNLADSGLDIPFVNIFFPKSVLFYKNEFPASSPEDCPVKIGYDGAQEAKCQNREWFDTFDNYREPHIVNIKHHWWWKLNFVNQYFKFGYLILVEEDHALSEDALHVLDLMKDIRVEKGADLIALGHYTNNLKLATKLSKTPAEQVKVEEWFSGAYNMAMAVSKRWVDDVIAMAYDFCAYDDYNWDWTLLHLSREILTQQPGKQPWKVMVPTLPRSQHLGITGCGVHFTKGGCNFENIKSMFEKDQAVLMNSGKMFPQSLTVASLAKKKSSAITRNGGWGDLRDILMCLEYPKNALDIDMSFLEKIKI